MNQPPRRRRRMVVAVSDPKRIEALLLEHGARFTRQQLDDAIAMRGDVLSWGFVMEELLRCGVMKWEDVDA